MANIIFSNHAKEMMGQRRIGEEEIKKALLDPDETLDGKYDAKIAHKTLNDKMLRVVYDISGDKYTVITAYITSKERYKK